MASEPQIVPPVPTVRQGEPISGPDTSSRVQNIFDRVAPEIKKSPGVKEAPSAPNEPDAKQPASTKERETPPAPPETPIEHKLPSFIDEALGIKGSQPETPQGEASALEKEFPEELPEFKTPEERKTRWKNFREAYNAVKKERDSLKARPAVDEGANARVEALDRENKEMRKVLERYTIEGNQEFQQKVLAPMTQAWNEAMKIVHEAGGDPQLLAKAMALGGKSQYEAIDEVFKDLPYSAQTEAHAALSTYRRLEDVRRRALSNAPQTVEALRKQDLARHHAFLQEQRAKMGEMYDNAVKLLRDKHNVELLKHSDDPQNKWWNDQAEEIIQGGKKLFLDGQEMDKVALACVLAPMAGKYREMWATERKARQEAEKTLKERFGGEPVIGDAQSVAPSQVDLNEPFDKAFLRKYHELRAGGR